MPAMTPRIPGFRFRTRLFAGALAVFGFAAGCSAVPDTVVAWAEELAPIDAGLRSYRLKPVVFSPEFIAQLKEKAQITEEHRIRPDSEFYEANAVSYVRFDSDARANTNPSGSLVIYPGEGGLMFSDEPPKADPTQEPVGVPTETEARALADALLKRLGIPLAELRRRNPGGEPWVVYGEQLCGERPKQPRDKIVYAKGACIRTVYYFHGLGGGDYLTGGRTMRGVNVSFGVGGRITYLHVGWANSEVAGVSASASRGEIERRMLTGEGTWQSPLPEGVQTLRVTRQQVVYPSPVKLSGVVAPSLILAVEVDAAGSVSRNTFTCSALASAGTGDMAE